MELFEEIKQEILERAHKANACKEQYGRAYKSKCIEELCEVIKDNFHWCCINSVLDGELIDKFKDTFSENKIYHNVSVNTGYLYASGSATVEAYDSATVEAYDSATVKASDSATVEAYDSATVEAYDSATVKASDSATVEAYDSATVKAYDSATVKAYGSATVKAYGSATVKAYDSATVKAYGSATVEASGSAYINCHSTIECVLLNEAIVRRWDTNTIQYASDKLTFEKIETKS